jgi:hypothetical protein
MEPHGHKEPGGVSEWEMIIFGKREKESYSASVLRWFQERIFYGFRFLECTASG